MSRCLYFFLILAVAACTDAQQQYSAEKKSPPSSSEEPSAIPATVSVPADTASKKKASSETVFRKHFDPFAGLSGDIRTVFTIDASRDTVIRTSGGLRLLVRANSFTRNGSPVRGAVMLQVKEKALAGMNIAGKQLSYVFQLEAFQRKAPLRFSRRIACSMPDGVKKSGQAFFELWDAAESEWQRIYSLSDLRPATSAVPFVQEARFPGGQEAMKRFLLVETAVPQTLSDGMLFVEITISEFGDVKAARVAKPLSPGLDAAVLQAALKMPMWYPAAMDEESIPVVYCLPVEVKNGSLSFKDAVPTRQRPESDEVFYLRETGIFGVE